MAERREAGERQRKPRADARAGKRSRRARVETSAGGVVFRRTDGRVHFLLIRDPYENWGLPKGHLEDGETPEAAALREVAEETGLDDLVVRATLPTIDWYFRDRGEIIHKFCHFFLFESPRCEAVPQREEGISECIWCSYHKAVRTMSYDNARDVLRAAGRQLGSIRPDGRGRPGLAG